MPPSLPAPVGIALVLPREVEDLPIRNLKGQPKRSAHRHGFTHHTVEALPAFPYDKVSTIETVKNCDFLTGDLYPQFTFRKSIHTGWP